jgi:DtxR family Mn-dependent transcriptional regulator
VPSARAQAYLETIYNATVEGDTVVNARLAGKFGVSPPKVTGMLRRLERDGYLILGQASGPQLTEPGRAAAEASLRRHRLAERFLFDVLHLDWVASHEEAHALQSALTPTIEAHIVAVLGNPTTCPHGNPMPGSAPRADDYLRAHQAFRLSGARLDTPVRVLCISEVIEDQTSVLRSVGEMGLRPRTDVIVRTTTSGEPGFLGLELAGKRETLSRAVAEKIWVFLPAKKAANSA